MGISNLSQNKRIINAYAGFAAASSASPQYVSLKNARHVTAVVTFSNNTTVTGAAITLSQATAVAGTGAKTLAFTKVWLNSDSGASDALVETTVSSNTFTFDDTDSKRGVAVIEIPAESLDTNNGFDCVRVNVANSTAQVVHVTYIVEPRSIGGTAESHITD